MEKVNGPGSMSAKASYVVYKNLLQYNLQKQFLLRILRLLTDKEASELDIFGHFGTIRKTFWRDWSI